MMPYLPEKMCNTAYSEEALQKAYLSRENISGLCIKCDEHQNLHVNFGNAKGIIPKNETAIGFADGTIRDYTILSCVGNKVCCKVKEIDKNGFALLSRKAAQEEAKAYILSRAKPGDVIPITVQNPTTFGAFCDIGCGVTALMRIARCCVSRLETTAQHFRAGQSAYAAIWKIDNAEGRIELTGRELLGTWEENAALFCAGQTVTGIIRSIMPYGIFIELTPNLSGLAECQPGLSVGDRVSVTIRSIQPQKRKIKLTVINVLPHSNGIAPRHYFIRSGHLKNWEYYPGSSYVTYF